MRILAGTISAIIVGALASWELTIVLIIIIPLTMLYSFGNHILIVGDLARDKLRLMESNRTAVESIDNIRTVVGLGCEEIFFRKYKSLLEAPTKYEMPTRCQSVFNQ